MYVGYDLQPITPNEVETFTFDFVNDVASGVTIVSATWLCSVASGTDASAASRLAGSPVNAGTRSSQRIAGCLDGVTYLIEARVVLSDGNTESLHSHLPCEAPA